MSTETTADVSGPLKAANEMIGREIVGRFRILAKLGEGGMGAVYRGEQIALKRAVAIKVLRNELSANQMVLSRFRAEAEAIARLDHPNTVKVYDTGQDADGALFIAMEYIDGKSLRETIQQGGPLPPARAFNIALQVAASLIDAHSQAIVHRDLKPDNVMLQNKNRQRDVVRVLDFGIAKLRDDSRQTQAAMTQAGDMLGTPQYMAPEQIKGEAIDGRTDIYALGCMIYEMVTARLPFEAPTIMAMLSKHLMEVPDAPSVRRPDLKLSPAIDQVVMMALQKDPNARPATMEQYADMLAGVMQSLPPDPSYQPSAAMSAASAPRSAIQSAQHTPTPQPLPYVPTPQGQPQPYVQAPPAAPVQPPSYQQQAAPYTPGYAPQPYAPPAIPPTMHVAGSQPKKSRLPLLLVLGALALGGAGVGVWAATRNSDAPTKDDYRAHLDTPGDDHGSSEAPHVNVDPPPQNNGADPWAAGTNPSIAPHAPRQPRQPQTPKAEHTYTCDQIATKGITLATQELQSQMASLTADQIQQVVQKYQREVPGLYKKIVDECNRTDMSDVQRECVMDAQTVADAQKCQ